MKKPELITVPAIHPTLTRPCAYCGGEIKGYSKVILLRTPGLMLTTTERDLQIHPDCLLPFAHWISEVAARTWDLTA